MTCLALCIALLSAAKVLPQEAEQASLVQKRPDEDEMREELGDEEDEPRSMRHEHHRPEEAEERDEEEDAHEDEDSFLQLTETLLPDLSDEQIDQMPMESLLQVRDGLQQHADQLQVLSAVLDTFDEMNAEDHEGEDSFEGWYAKVMSKLGELKNRTDEASLVEKVAKATAWTASALHADQEAQTADAASNKTESLLEGKEKIASLEHQYDEDFSNAYVEALKKDMAKEPSSLVEDAKDVADPFAKVEASLGKIREEMQQTFSPQSLSEDKVSVAVGSEGSLSPASSNTHLRNEK